MIVLEEENKLAERDRAVEEIAARLGVRAERGAEDSGHHRRRDHGIELEYEVELWRANEPQMDTENTDQSGKEE